MNDAMGQVYKTVFSKSRMVLRRFEVKEPPSSRTKIVEMCYLYHRTGQYLTNTCHNDFSAIPELSCHVPVREVHITGGNLQAYD